MNFPFYIARRYLFSKKSTHAINIISAISVVGVAVATMALVVTLSVFNGFHDMVARLFTSFDPQLKITPVTGKTANASDPILTQIKQLPAVEVATETLEDHALVMYLDRQAMVTLKGVEDNFDSLTYIRDILYGDGEYELQAAEMSYGILGIRLAEQLGTGFHFDEPLKVYAARRQGQLDMADPTDGFVEDELYSPGALFYVKQGKYDKNYIITNLEFARRLFDREGQLSALELRLKNGTDFDRAKAEIKRLAGTRYNVSDRYEQQADTFRIMQIEKLIGYVFLTFILMVACFNIISSVSMLIIDKKDDVATLRNLGATDKQITQVFLFEGRIISFIGAVLGIGIGLLLCWLQQEFGLVRLGSQAGSFIIEAYPVSVHPWDIVIIFLTVLIVGWLAVWYPVRYLSRRLL